MDHRRALLLADHASKGLTGMVKDALEQPYVVHQPDCQYGARGGRGIDMASQIFTSLVEYVAAPQMWSIFVLFVDLTKAVDFIIRQLLHGWGRVPADQRLPRVRDLGVAPQAAEWITQCISEHGSLIGHWGEDPVASAMARTLHEGAWLAIDGRPTAVASQTGGRRGCKLGAQMFNNVYGVALHVIAWELDRRGVALKVAEAPREFWRRRRA
ncbi:unnamed protein product [Prorocentrum cordatum]|uniref:Uncharacterized protein n=1 Tax=Prorocentrum cordatum TaxID=2364126 RepID=A0ABN9X8U5_9DINO|nr:unnamed protein product [Polarella glacialis]